MSIQDSEDEINKIVYLSRLSKIDYLLTIYLLNKMSASNFRSCSRIGV